MGWLMSVTEIQKAERQWDHSSSRLHRLAGQSELVTACSVSLVGLDSCFLSHAPSPRVIFHMALQGLTMEPPHLVLSSS